MNKAKRAAALTVCIGMILVMFFSSVYIAHVAGHICTGEECEICQRVQDTVAMLHGFAMLGVLLFLLFALPLLRHAFHVARGLFPRPCRTLVSWKVRLND
ncbi:MAG: hypothetical protein IJ157_10295 [Clostridia bacterium]|nr:hypothetical protein [Clostridia bacterium]